MINFVGDKKLLEPELYREGTLEECLEFLNSISIISADIETSGLSSNSDHILSIQLGNKEEQWVIDSKVIPLIKLKSLLEDPSKLFLFQNAKFDLGFILSEGINVSNIYDTLLAECILTTGKKNRKLGLDSLALKYCNVVLDKSIRASIVGLTDSVIVYGANDIKYLEDIKNKQEIAIEELGLSKLLDLENKAVKVFSKMEHVGVLIDREKWNTVSDTVDKNLKESFITLDSLVKTEPKLSKFVPEFVQGNLFGFEERLLDINWSSNSQKLKLVKNLVPEIEAVGEKDLQKNKTKHPIIEELINYAKQNKLATSFGRNYLNFINSDSGRIHPNYWQILNTGRISCKEPNLNQIPSKGELGKIIRSCFIPRKGMKYVGGDYSGMELRIIAEFSQDPLWVSSFVNGEDLHSVLCSQTFDIDIKDVKTPFYGNPDVSFRDVQKTINFGLA